jgi:hypothetical protein
LAGLRLQGFAEVVPGSLQIRFAIFLRDEP